MKVLNMSRHFKFVAGFMAACCVALFSGCSTVRIIESQVQTSPQWAAASGAGSVVPTKALYRLERLPADVNNLQAGWAEVELEAALQPLAWTRNDVDAQYSVWIGVRTAEFMADAWGRPVRGPWVNHVYVSVGTGHRPRGVGANVAWNIGMPVYSGMRPGLPPAVGYAQEVSIIIRDLKTSQVVYQTKATHDGPWADHQNILRALISAALQGFPNPQVLQRRVDIAIPR